MPTFTYTPRLTGPLRQPGQAGILFSGRRDGVAGVCPAFGRAASFRVENKGFQFGALGNAGPQALPSMSSFFTNFAG